MSPTAVHAQGQKRGNLHRLRIAGSQPAQWGPMPYEESLAELRRYVVRHGFPVQLDTVHEDGSIWSQGFTPNGRIEEIGQSRPPSRREDGGLGAAFIATPPAAAAPTPRPARRADPDMAGAANIQQSRRRGGPSPVPGPADNYGPDVKSTTWAASMPELAPISLDAPPPEPSPETPAKPSSRRARRERESSQSAERPASQLRSNLPPLDAPRPTGIKDKASEWARNLNTGSLVAGGTGLALAGAGIYFCFETGVLPF